MVAKLLKMLVVSVIALIALAQGALAAVEASKRVALVIGNGAYKSVDKLPNPTVDAKAVAAALRRLGFEVFEGYDLDYAAMAAKLGEFYKALPDAQQSLVYYAGHGVAFDEENYLLPVDIALKSMNDLELRSIGLNQVLKVIARSDTVNVAILDACRDNPFDAEIRAAVKKTRGVLVERGLAPVSPAANGPHGTMIAFATDPKTTALDGKVGENSPFTKALLAHIEDPDVSVGTLMDTVRADVFKATGGKQTPWSNSSIIGNYILNPVGSGAKAAEVAGLQGATADQAGTPAFAAARAERQAQENRFWDSAEKSNAAEDYTAYLDAYPNGTYAQMAKGRIARLGGAAPAAPAAATIPEAAPPIAPALIKAEVGTQKSEAALSLDQARRKQLQARLKILEYDPKENSGVFSTKTRNAIIDWQTRHETAATGWLGPVQLAALMQESEVPYQRLLAAEPMVPAAQQSASRGLRIVKPQAVAPAIRQARIQRTRARPAAQDSGFGAAFGAAVGNFAGSMLRRR